MKLIKTVLVILLIVLAGMQFVRPEKNTSDNVATTDLILNEKPPMEVAVVLKQACYDCHSNNTNYPWYAEVAPISYWIADHVEEGKEHLNFSAWTQYSAKKKAHKMEELIEEVEEHEMPLDSYTWMHKDAKLDEAQIEALNTWAGMLRAKYELDAQVQ
ncbi:heme-binding domain-containing protein [Robertkochia sediminum]|uniref:heme-binding domain-containing protein n=1 Tax=Robertkochia sediminum TaxID=2785326 RepID=UPI0019323927|nr:heme-binding domain-containing protein [Robertkochia sediminum]MBL7473152.1 heme-binding domain-containing protein [Robertkochia sediminum]